MSLARYRGRRNLSILCLFTLVYSFKQNAVRVDVLRQLLGQLFDGEEVGLEEVVQHGPRLDLHTGQLALDEVAGDAAHRSTDDHADDDGCDGQRLAGDRESDAQTQNEPDGGADVSSVLDDALLFLVLGGATNWLSVVLLSSFL